MEAEDYLITAPSTKLASNLSALCRSWCNFGMEFTNDTDAQGCQMVYFHSKHPYLGIF
jgi:hypothetical protein